MTANRRFWLQWIAANALGELVGLGAAAAVAIGLLLAVGEPKSLIAAAALALAMIAAGTGEGVIVGWAQWRVLRQRLPAMPQGRWVRATAVGALVAWTFGMAPSTLMSQQETGGAPPWTPSELQVMLLAAAMGAVLGPILGLPQWLALRRYVRRAHWWIWANAAAWLAGMPLVFLGAGASPTGASPARIALTIAATILAAGAVVGAIHGAALLRLLKQD
ncbi:MAG: hypothetical protein SF339_18780 [Blastocatellia bacterium]|nr:hypothetical protein [Blastocatellia bacterium]